MADHPIFIALEGIDGSGKSTQARQLAVLLRDKGHKVYTTFEPTDGPIGTLIRNVMKGEMDADHKTIAALFVADRLDHVLNEQNGILRMLREGYIVITDRYYFSSYAYHGTHMDMDWVIGANSQSSAILKPSVNVFIDVSPEVSFDRITRNRASTELYETLENLRNVRAKYLEAFEKLKNEERIVFVDGDQDPEAITMDIWKEIAGLLEDKIYG
jgi:dTMP kinase